MRVLEHSGPEGGSLMCVVDLNDSELLHKLVVNLELLLLELRNNLFSQVDCKNSNNCV
jgi:hypothetical protein